MKTNIKLVVVLSIFLSGCVSMINVDVSGVTSLSSIEQRSTLYTISSFMSCDDIDFINVSPIERTNNETHEMWEVFGCSGSETFRITRTEEARFTTTWETQQGEQFRSGSRYTTRYSVSVARL